MDNKTESNQDLEPRRNRGIYLLPNFFTTLGLFAGFYAIVAAMKGLFDVSAIAIYVAMIADGLDGRVARLTNTQSKFGAEFDSLSDIVGFGIAPALLAYSLALSHLGKVGWLIAFCYLAATALRLARFNIQEEGDDEVDKRYFQGLPCPAAAGLVAGLVWIERVFTIHGKSATGLIIIAVLAMAILMVSNVRYLSFKDVDLKGKVPFFMILLMFMMLVAIAWDPPKVLFTAFLVYAISGPVMAVRRYLRKDSSNKNRND